METMYPDYGNCIANLACSIIKHFGAEPPNPALPLADKLLEKRYKNVILLLLDGMGLNIINENLEPDGFFRRNIAGVYSSVFPPTTVAATTSLDSGLYPSQSAWLGWTGYFKELDRNIEYFTNKDFDTEQPVEGVNVGKDYVPYRDICSIIREDTRAKAYYMPSFRQPEPNDFGALCKEVLSLANIGEEKYIYMYYHEPDSIMHRKGCFGEKAKLVLRDIELQTEEFADRLPEGTLLLITADHGHINSPKAVITDYPDIMECLVRMPSIEPRCSNLFIKEGMDGQLKRAFKEHFPDDFILISKAEAFERGLFGTGTHHPRLNEMVGDYLAVAVGNISLYNKKSKNFVANHAGLTRDEMEIALIKFEK